jgi:type 1 fimbria pilin
MRTLKVFLFAVTVVLVAACSGSGSADKSNDGTMEFTGVIQQAGMTSYQYGTHTLTTGDNKLYALKSSTVDLNKYNGKSVVVKGKMVDGYPVENGPELIEVTEVKE